MWVWEENELKASTLKQMYISTHFSKAREERRILGVFFENSNLWFIALSMTWKEIFCYLIIYKGANDVPDQIDLQVFCHRGDDRGEYLNLIYCLFKQNFICNALEIVCEIFWKSLCSLEFSILEVQGSIWPSISSIVDVSSAKDAQKDTLSSMLCSRMHQFMR